MAAIDESLLFIHLTAAAIYGADSEFIGFWTL